MSNQPLVIDNGSGFIKAGFAGNDTPRVIFNSYVGTVKHSRMMPGGILESADTYVGKKVSEHRGLFSIKYAMEHGIVKDWNDMEMLWRHIYSKDMLNVDSAAHPILLTEAPLNPVSNRCKAAEVFFESFGAPALFVSPQAVLSLYASGRTTGVVVDCGDGVTHVVPVYESFTLPHAITRMDVAGRDVTKHLQRLLQRGGTTLHTSAEMEIVREMKEQVCYVAYNPAKEEQMEEDNMGKTAMAHTLPDGTSVQVECF